MKKWFNYFLYASIAFLIIILIKADYLIIPDITNKFSLFISLFLVCLGFVFDAISWFKALSFFGFNKVGISDAIVSSGLSVFGKYIPGKIWIILGRSAYISKRYKMPEKETAAISLNAQFISLWVGLTLGIFGLLFIGNKYHMAELSILLWIILTVLLYTDFFHKLFHSLVKVIFKTPILIPRLKFKEVLQVLPWFFTYWIFWCFGFYFLILSLGSVEIKLYAGLAFALAGTLGILAFIMPGGVGVREGILTILLIMAGINEKLAITISITSRLWFLIGETFIFIVAMSVKVLKK